MATFKFAHNNFNVLDLERSMKFYEEALGLKEVRRIDGEGFKIVFLGDEPGKHEQMGCICYENTTMGIYFIVDPDGYWVEILPPVVEEKY